MGETVVVYGGLLVSILVFSIIKNKKFYNSIISTLFVLILGLRASSVGADTTNYISHFFEDQAKVLSLKQFLYFEPGYMLLTKIIGFFTNNGQVFIFIISLIMIYLFQKSVYKDLECIYLSYFLFVTFGFYFSSFVIIRQFLAMVILWHSLDAIKNRKFVKFLLYVILAMSFHKTAIIFILLYFIYPLNVNKKYFILISICTIGSILFLNRILSFSLSLIPKYSVYIKNLNPGQGLKLLLLYSVIFIFVFMFRKKILPRDKIYIHMLGIAVVLQGTAYSFSLLTRLTQYFALSIIVLIPNILYRFKNNLIKIMGISSIVIFSLLYLTLILSQNKMRVIPYIFCFQN